MNGYWQTVSHDGAAQGCHPYEALRLLQRIADRPRLLLPRGFRITRIREVLAQTSENHPMVQQLARAAVRGAIPLPHCIHAMVRIAYPGI